MDALLEQLSLNNSFFIEFGIISVLFFFLSNLYFKPFLKLFEARHKRTVEDRESAVQLLAEANAKLEEYQRLLLQERMAAKKELDAALDAARKQEAGLLAHAREESKKITQEAIDSVNRQREELKKKLESDVETMAQTISERLLSRNA